MNNFKNIFEQHVCRDLRYITACMLHGLYQELFCVKVFTIYLMTFDIVNKNKPLIKKPFIRNSSVYNSFKLLIPYDMLKDYYVCKFIGYHTCHNMIIFMLSQKAVFVSQMYFIIYVFYYVTAFFENIVFSLNARLPIHGVIKQQQSNMSVYPGPCSLDYFQ